MIAAVTAGLAVGVAVLLARPGAGAAPAGARLARLTRRGTGAQLAGGPPSTGQGERLSVPMLLDLVAEVLASGAAPPRALALVGECLDRVHDPSGGDLVRLAAQLTGTATASARAGPASARPGTRSGPVSGVDVLAAALALCVATGAGPVTLIRAAAEEHRRRTHAEQVRAAHRLGVLVLLPTGLCLLPAFVLLTVVPLVIDLVLG